MKAIYAGYISAHHLYSGMAICPISIVASSKSEAIGMAIEHARKVKQPIEDGYYSHTADLVHVTEEQIRIVFDLPMGDKC